MDLTEAIGKITSLDWGCGCCSSADENDLENQIREILQELLSD